VVPRNAAGPHGFSVLPSTVPTRHPEYVDPFGPRDLRDILPEPIEDTLELFPFGPGGSGGSPSVPRPALLAYRAFEWKGARFGWTDRPDGLGQYGGLLIRMSRDGWSVVAAESFPSVDAARAWAGRRWAEASGLFVDEAP
jgi:hypothetical protein